MAPRHDLTLRLTGLPNNTTKEAISNFLQDNKIDLRCIQSIGQPCLSTNDDDCTATVTFWGAGAATKARNAITRKSQDHVRADMEFQGMSTIYSSDNPFKGKPDVDIVAVHGLEGHAYNSWTYTECIGDGRWKEVMWLRDLLPRVAESRGIHPRVMTFGYNARVFHDITVADIGSPAIQLLHCLDTERKVWATPLVNPRVEELYFPC
ncbi:MAG: hypothetical protein M1813_001512 [Trichoglossum hirsutum]|nr:MAG: hypothetical protein M1813_001512 [Trichoglossum hirsutum]